MTSPRTKKQAPERAPHRATRDTVKRSGSEEARALYTAFGEYNRAHFRRKLASPLVLVTHTGRAMGDYIQRDEHGLESRIRISPRAVKLGARFMLDVLLHEMCHAWVHEIEHTSEPGYRGHGPVFAAVCNRIGEALGVGKVGVKGRDGLPDCSYWPMCVRPDGYYPEPFKAPTRQDKPAPESESESESESDDDSDAPPKDVKRASARALKGAHEAARILREYIDNWAPEDAAERNDKINVRAVVWHLEQLAGPAAVPQQSDLFP